MMNENAVRELNMEELETVSGGNLWDKVCDVAKDVGEVAWEVTKDIGYCAKNTVLVVLRPFVAYPQEWCDWWEPV